MKQYITWEAKKKNDNCFEHPNTNNIVEIETNWQTIFTETPYKIADGRYISFVEYPNDTDEPTKLKYLNLEPEFKFKFIDETEANLLLSELGDVTVSNFIFEDNRPNLDATQ